MERSGKRQVRSSGSVAVRAGTGIGLLGGLALGAVEGPTGALLGVVAGALAGFIAGAVLERESARAAAHDRELDAEIGVTRGSLGARPIRRRPELDADFEPWGNDWLTPPPPQVG